MVIAVCSARDIELNNQPAGIAGAWAENTNPTGYALQPNLSHTANILEQLQTDIQSKPKTAAKTKKFSFYLSSPPRCAEAN